MRRVNTRERKDCIIDSGDNRRLIAKRMTQAIKRRKKNRLSTVFHLAIDATKNAKVLEVSHAHRKIIGGAHPNRLIDIEGRTKTDVQKILDGNSTTHDIFFVANKIKVTAMLFQNSPAGIPPIEVVAARPQTSNESATFANMMEKCAGQASSGAGARVVNFSVDGVSCEAKHVILTICLFLGGEHNHLGATYANHNANSARYQIIAAQGTEGVSLGRHMLDTKLLRLAKSV